MNENISIQHFDLSNVSNNIISSNQNITEEVYSAYSSLEYDTIICHFNSLEETQKLSALKRKNLPLLFFAFCNPDLRVFDFFYQQMKDRNLKPLNFLKIKEDMVLIKSNNLLFCDYTAYNFAILNNKLSHLKKLQSLGYHEICLLNKNNVSFFSQLMLINNNPQYTSSYKESVYKISSYYINTLISHSKEINKDNVEIYLPLDERLIIFGQFDIRTYLNIDLVYQNEQLQNKITAVFKKIPIMKDEESIIIKKISLFNDENLKKLYDFFKKENKTLFSACEKEILNRNINSNKNRKNICKI